MKKLVIDEHTGIDMFYSLLRGMETCVKLIGSDPIDTQGPTDSLGYQRGHQSHSKTFKTGLIIPPVYCQGHTIDPLRDAKATPLERSIAIALAGAWGRMRSCSKAA